MHFIYKINVLWIPSKLQAVNQGQFLQKLSTLLYLILFSVTNVNARITRLSSLTRETISNLSNFNLLVLEHTNMCKEDVRDLTQSTNRPIISRKPFTVVTPRRVCVALTEYSLIIISHSYFDSTGTFIKYLQLCWMEEVQYTKKI